jgi:hypothetical protein
MTASSIKQPFQSGYLMDISDALNGWDLPKPVI